MVRLYGTHCPKCNVIEKKLNAKGVEFEMIDDNSLVVQFGKDHDIFSAPILEVDDQVLDFAAANKYISTL